MSRTRFLAVLPLLAAGLVAAVFLMPAVQAAIPASAYYVGDDDAGVITIAAPAGTRYQVFAEQADGTYNFTAGGTISDTGSVSTSAVPSGVIGNGTPMFVVKVSNAGGEVLWLSVPISDSDDHLWGWL